MALPQRISRQRPIAAEGGLPVGNAPANIDMGPDMPPMRYDATPNVSRAGGKVPAPGEPAPATSPADALRRAALRKMGIN